MPRRMPPASLSWDVFREPIATLWSTGPQDFGPSLRRTNWEPADASAVSGKNRRQRAGLRTRRTFPLLKLEVRNATPASGLPPARSPRNSGSNTQRAANSTGPVDHAAR